MKLGYSKMNENKNNNNNQFPQRSRSKKEYAFLDQDVELRLYQKKKSQKYQNQPSPSPAIDDGDENKKVKDEINNTRGGGERKSGSTLRRNFSVSSASTYQKNRRSSGNNGQIERQSSTRSIQGAVKRAFSMNLKRSSSSNSEKYCRIYDQSSTLDNEKDADYSNDDQNNDGDSEKKKDDDDDDDDGSVESRSAGMKKKEKKKTKNKEEQNNAKKHVGSRVARAWKRLFSR